MSTITITDAEIVCALDPKRYPQRAAPCREGSVWILEECVR